MVITFNGKYECLHFFPPFRFQSETVRLIIENALGCASFFQCVHLGGVVGVGGGGGGVGRGWRLMAGCFIS